MRYIVAIVVFACSLAGSTFGQDYRDETIQHVVEPCIRAANRQAGLDQQLGADQALESVK